MDGKATSSAETKDVPQEAKRADCDEKPIDAFYKKANTTISNVNNEMSSVLRNSIMHLDDICVRVKSCLEDISQNNRRYEMLKSLPKVDVPVDPGAIASQISLDYRSLVELVDANESIDDKCQRCEETASSRGSETKEEQEVAAIAKSMSDTNDRIKTKATKAAVNNDNRKKAGNDGKKTNASAESEARVEKPKKNEQKLIVLKKAIARIPSTDNKKDRLMRLLAYKSLSNKARVDLVDHLKRRPTRPGRKQTDKQPNVIVALPPKKLARITNRRQPADDRFADSLFFGNGSGNSSTTKTDAKNVRRSTTDPKLSKTRQSSVASIRSGNDNNATRKSTVDDVVSKSADALTSDDSTQQQQQLQAMKRLARDSLDKLREDDLEPILSEYPRKDNAYVDEACALRNSFLYKLTNAGEHDDRTLRLFFDVPQDRASASGQMASSDAWNAYSPRRKRRKEAIMAKLRPLLLTETNATQTMEAARKNRATSLAKLMIDPTVKHYDTYTVMPVRVVYDNANDSRSRPLEVEQQLQQQRPVFGVSTVWKHYKCTTTNRITVKPSNRAIRPKVITRWDNERRYDATAMSATRRLHQQRMLMCNRYRKTVGQKLVNYVQNQQPLYAYCETSGARRRPTMATLKEAPFEPMEKFNPTTYRQSRFLSRDISRIVGTIEQKIVEVLADPGENNSAFNEIEREIKDVLAVMQRMKSDLSNARTFDLPTLLSESNSEKSDTENAASRKSSTSFRTGNSNLSLHSCVLCANEMEPMPAAAYCDKILQEIADTREELRKIQAEELNGDVQNKSIDDDEREIVKEEESKTDETNEEMTSKETDVVDEPVNLQADDNIDEVLLKLQEFSFAEIDIGDSEIPQEVSQEDSCGIDSLRSDMKAQEMTLKKTINQRLKEIYSRKEEIVSMNRLINAGTMKTEEKASEESEQRNRGDPPSNLATIRRSKETIEQKQKDVQPKEMSYTTGRKTKQRQRNVETKSNSDCVQPKRKKPKLIVPPKKVTQSTRRLMKRSDVDHGGKNRVTLVASTSRFLTPYFQAIKKYRDKLQTSSTKNMLDFLDKLTNITHPKETIAIKQKRTVIQKAAVIEHAEMEGRATSEWQTRYSFTSCKWDEADVYFSESEPESSHRPTEILSPIHGIKELVDNLNAIQSVKETPSTCAKCKKSVAKNKVSAKSQTSKERVPSASKKVRRPKKPTTNAKIKNANDDEYSAVLSAVYGIVFSVMYVGLQMDFSCDC